MPIAEDPVEVRGDHPHLLSALREELGITSPKDGCSPSGQCGCCTVHIDGKAVVACQQPLSKVAGKSVLTLEGVDADERDRYASAFAACGGLQCGFCIPGIVMRAKAQVDKKGAELERNDMARHLGAHLCRCTGYVKVLDAIEAGAAGYLLKDAGPDDVIAAVRAAQAGGATLDPRAARVLLDAQRRPAPPARLSARELEVLGLVASGLANKQIALRLGISERTVKAHLTTVFAQLGVTDRTQAALWAKEHLPPTPG